MTIIAAELTLLEAETAVAELQRDVIDAEVAAGLSVPWAARPLHDHEVRAEVRFAALDHLTQTTTRRITEHLTRLRVVTVGALGAELADVTAAPPSTVVDHLRVLGSPTSTRSLPGVEQAQRDTTAAILAALTALFAAAADELAGEARRQGVPAGQLPEPGSVTADQATTRELGLFAARATDAVPPGLLGAALDEAVKGLAAGVATAELLQLIGRRVETLPPAGPVDLGKQAAGRAQGLGRTAGAAQAPVPAYVYASELLDGNTCQQCSQVDGTQYDTEREALTDYPAGGTYRRCQGGLRCRGTLVYVWRTEAPPTITDQNPMPDPIGPFEFDNTMGRGFADRLATAGAAIERVHRLPEQLPTVRVRAIFGTAAHRGTFDPATMTIRVNPGADIPELTYVHEIGHYLDLHLLGNGQTPATLFRDDRYVAWWTAITSSRVQPALQTAMRDMTSSEDYRAHAAYLARPIEMWARSYAQWIALRSGDRTLIEQVESQLSSGGSDRWRQWDSDDFTAIAAAIDGLLGGWLT